MSDPCPFCGAVDNGLGTCQEIFDNFLVLEFQDAGYGAVHFLTVACFFIQHNRYSDEGLRWIRDKLREYLTEDLTGEQIRSRAAAGTQNSVRDWKVTRAADAPPLPMIAWKMTIADVAEQFTDAESYQTLVKQWAWIVLEQIPVVE